MTYPFAIHCLTDNFSWLVADAKQNALVVDPGESKAVKQVITERGLHLTHILVTHYHFDHIGGVAELSADTGAEVWAPQDTISPTHKTLAGGDKLDVCGYQMEVIDTPGHAFNHISLFFPALEALFCGDVLFTLGCGRLFDGTAQEMWSSLKKLRNLPPQTLVCSGHDYTTANLKFINSLKGLGREGIDTITKLETTRKDARDNKQPVLGVGLPTRIGDEICANPFLLADDSDFLKANGISKTAGVESFAEIRRRKDIF